MALPVRNLPLVQNWDCHSCGDCCRQLEAVITDEEKQRLEMLDLSGDPEIAAGPWFVSRGWLAKGWALRRRLDGSCVFLTSANRCRLHERFGAESKPFVCRLFPFILIPAGNHWRVGLRFACPSSAGNNGRPLTDHQSALVQFSHLLEKHVGQTGDSAPTPPLQPGQQVPWDDLIRFVQALMEIVEDRGDRLERRLRKCVALSRLCRQARFENVTGGRLTEFLHVVRSGLDSDVPRTAAEAPPPGWIGRVLFRTLLAVYARKDLGQYRGPATRSSFGRLLSGWRFVRGKGPVPRVNTLLPATTFEEIEKLPALPKEFDETLERYYLVKLSSLQFCGPANFDLPFWDGLQSLLLTMPMICWLTKAFSLPVYNPGLSALSAVEKAIFLVDDHFGGNPILGAMHNRFFVRTLGHRGDLDRLIAWYGRAAQPEPEARARDVL
jgi:lysine-N-methylase